MADQLWLMTCIREEEEDCQSTLGRHLWFVVQIAAVLCSAVSGFVTYYVSQLPTSFCLSYYQSPLHLPYVNRATSWSSSSLLPFISRSLLTPDSKPTFFTSPSHCRFLTPNPWTAFTDS